jgi:hypothetical protein
MTQIHDQEVLFNGALQILETTPTPVPLNRALKAAAAFQDVILADDTVDQLWNEIINGDINKTISQRFGRYLRRLDCVESAGWTIGTPARSMLRRHTIYDGMGIAQELWATVDERYAVAEMAGNPIVIAEMHREWYDVARRAKSSFYWSAYSRHLSNSGWNEESIQDLDKASSMIVERLSDPEQEEIFNTKGLVVGYVQSGKTANFTAVTAKAADAGYRLIIILAGTLNILRAQTQRRIDKELIGTEIISGEPDANGQHDYVFDNDWDAFLKHGGLPSHLGFFDWERLTGAQDDYQRLKRGISALEFKKMVQGRRFNDAANLALAPVRLIVMKKTPPILGRLNDDLARLRTALEEVPVLIIDDESDQASINTRKPTTAERKDRTATNKEIIRLLALLPRAQYIGYTATPFANVFVDPTDTVDLFPKDYIVALERPTGYMGASDFYDFAEDGSDLAEEERPDGFRSKERAYIRDLYNQDDRPENLPKAIDSFILSGAIKLYRKANGLSLKINHHTMLIHRSVKKSEHAADKELVERIYNNAGIGTAEFYDRLETLWTTDFLPVSTHQNPAAPMPVNFEALRIYIDQCVTRIEASGEAVRVVNSDAKWEGHLPNFDRDNVWAILVGGSKLSRGYTVEGLTISYFRRRIGTADTLMQAGRWFGFRRGYKDLVRVFIGRAEPDSGKRKMDLCEAFKSISQDEEMFRSQLRKYVSPDAETRIRPIDVPPLVPSHMLMPTSKNKMWNAEVRHQNMANQWKEHTLSADSNSDREFNANLFAGLIQTGSNGSLPEFEIKMDDGKSVIWEGHLFDAASSEIAKFLNKFRWQQSLPVLQREIEFIMGKGRYDPKISRWVVIVPQKADDDGIYWGKQKFSVFRRARTGSGAFKVFSERRHRLVAEYLSDMHSAYSVSSSTSIARAPGTAVLVCYPVVGKGDDVPVGALKNKDVTIGFGIQFPDNDIDIPITFGLRDKDAGLTITIGK